MGVSKIRGTPKWMVKIMENPIKMDDLGRTPTNFGNTHLSVSYQHSFQQLVSTQAALLKDGAKGAFEVARQLLAVSKHRRHSYPPGGHPDVFFPRFLLVVFFRDPYDPK